MKKEMLKGQVALITGGSAGIGKAIAKKFVEEGVGVAIFAKNSQRGNSTVHEIQQEYPHAKARFYSVNLSNREEVRVGVDQTLKDFGAVDILVNNAGIARDRLLMKMTPEDWSQVMDINVNSCYYLSHALIRSMVKARRGTIINISSVVGITGNAGQANYAASKAAMIGFTKSLAKEYASRGITVNAIAPGFIKTEMTDSLNEKQKEEIFQQIPMRRMGQPNEVADAALFLALSKYITGHVLTVDGGMTTY